jgi:uncharacterized protein YggE
MHRSGAWILSAVAGALAMASVACTSDTNVTVDQPQQTGISVTGTGSVTVVPDIGVISLGVEVSRTTVADARSEAAASMDAVRTALKRASVEDRDIATQYFNIQPQYGNSTSLDKLGMPTIVGYTVTNQVTVKVRKVDNLSTVLDAAIAAGGNAMRVNGVSFTVDDPERYQSEAREKAVADAKQRAGQLASLANVKLGAARAITESNNSGGGAYPVAVAAQRSGDTALSPGETEVSLTVSVVFDVER